MDAKSFFSQDIKGIASLDDEMKGKFMAMAAKIIDRNATAEDATNDSFFGKAAAKNEWIVLTAIDALADANGRARGGMGSLGTTIMAQQAHKIEQFGDKAYKLSDKQRKVVLTEAFHYLGKY